MSLNVSVGCPKCGSTVVFSLQPNQVGGKCSTCYKCYKQVCITYDSSNNQVRIKDVR